MAIDPKTMNLETLPDAWERFERAVDIGVKTPPMHREPPKPKKKATEKKAKKLSS